MVGPYPTCQVEQCQNKALCNITGQLETTPLEALRMKTGVPSVAAQAQQQAVAYGKAH